jgi:hypothetical protein
LEQVAVTVIGGVEVGGAVAVDVGVVVGVAVAVGVVAGIAGGGGARVGVGVVGRPVGWTGAEAQAARLAVATRVVISRVNFMTTRR